jgi:hypothetical protein
LCILSFKTINTLLVRAGYENYQIIPYHSDFAEMKQRNDGTGRSLIVCGEFVIELIEKMFPLMSFGLIVEIAVEEVF